MVGLRFLNIRLWQNLNELKSITNTSFHWLHIKRFIQNDLQTFVHVFHFGQEFNHLFLVFCVINFPINAYIVMLLILGKVNRFSALVFACLAYQQVFCIFLIHLCIAQFTKKANHRSAKFLLAVMVQKQHKIGHFRDRLSLVEAIFRLHSSNQYGFTYGRCGLVTFNKFFKVYISARLFILNKSLHFYILSQCLLLYGKFLMYSYKLITNIWSLSNKTNVWSFLTVKLSLTSWENKVNKRWKAHLSSVSIVKCWKYMY